MAQVPVPPPLDFDLGGSIGCGNVYQYALNIPQVDRDEYLTGILRYGNGRGLSYYKHYDSIRDQAVEGPELLSPFMLTVNSFIRPR